MRILFITANRLGDAVLTTGLLAWLAERHADARFTIACGPVAAPIFVGVPGLEAVHVLRKGKLAAHWRGLWLRAWRTRWDLIVDLRASVLAWVLRARRRRVIGKAPNRLHRVEHLAALFDLDPPPGPKLWIPDAATRRAEALIPMGGPILAIGPAANWRGKQWPAERFGTVARNLTAPGGPLPGARVAVLAAEAERPQAAPVLDVLPAGRSIDLVGAVDPIEAAACLQRATVFIGNDSGLMHLSAAAGTPTLGLFGPSKEAHYRPWGAHGAYVRTALPHDALVGGPGYDRRSVGTLMVSLSTAAVEAAAHELLARRRRNPIDDGAPLCATAPTGDLP